MGKDAVRILFWGLLIFLVVIFQGSGENFLEIRGVRPDLILIIVYCMGLLHGEYVGGIAGLGLGWLMDLSSMGPLYQNLVTKGVIGVFAGYLGTWLRHAGPFLHLWILLGVSFLQGFLVSLVLSLIYDSSILSDLRYIVLPQAIYDAVLGSFILNLLVFLRERRRKIQWAGSP
ncbi:MAG: rod shape-determining protein MreD [Nitrospirae bacterium]|nr:rod shape-determining protein MreD [Nitrospirota bacterium]